MRLATLKVFGEERAFLLNGVGFVAVAELGAHLGRKWPADLLALLTSGAYDDLLAWYRTAKDRNGVLARCSAVAPERAVFGPLYRHPRKIWGIGLNYREHAADLDEVSPTAEPGSFMKPDTTIIGPGDTIQIPKLSQKTTGEAELGLVFGRRCSDVPLERWREALAGFTTIIDMTAEDILRRNVRNLTQCKSFDTFFSFGPLLVSTDEVESVNDLEVTTVHNGRVHAQNRVGNMTFPPDFLVSYHSRIMTMLPGDVISSGTPGAAVLADGDTIEAQITGFQPLVNSVRDLKRG